MPRPRPGHGDLSGSIKYLGSIRGVLERASARETTVRVAAGALAKQLLDPFGIAVFGYVVQVGPDRRPSTARARSTSSGRCASRASSTRSTPTRTPKSRRSIDQAAKQGNTLGGVVEVRVEGVPFGLGSHTQWDKKLDGRLAQAVMSVQAIKGVEIGMGFEAARHLGSEVHDPIHYDPALADTPSLGFTRPTNNAGGLEAGMTNSQPIVIRAAKKPISTLARPLESVNLQTKQPEKASYERSDICAIAAASCIVENVVAFEIARAMVDKFGGDSLAEMQARWKLFHDMAREKLEDRENTTETRRTRRKKEGAADGTDETSGSLTEAIIGGAIEVQRELGPGLMESAYEECLCHELSHRGLAFQRQVPLPIKYKKVKLDCGYRMDVVVAETVVLELKAVEMLQPLHEAQLMTYLKLSRDACGPVDQLQRLSSERRHSFAESISLSFSVSSVSPWCFSFCFVCFR